MIKQQWAWLLVLIGSSLLISSLLVSSPTLAQASSDRQLLFELLNRIEQSEQEIRQLRGDLELYRHRQEAIERNLQAVKKNSKNDLAGSTKTVNEPANAKYEWAQQQSLPSGSVDYPSEERTPGASSSAFSSPRPNTTSFSTTPSIAERAAYNAAFNQLRDGNYQSAITEFQQFLQMYPGSGLVGDAQYWLGEAYYITRDFDKAKQAFITVGVNYPESEKLPEAMLKLGYVYDELGDTNKAREVLLKLAQTYPDSRAANLAKQRLQVLR